MFIFAYLLIITVVKKHLKSTTNKVFVIALCLMLLVNVLASIYDYGIVLKATKALSIPIFFSLYFIKNKFINNIFIAFLMLMFFGDLFSMLPTSTMQLKIASAAYFCCYAMLILIGFFRITRFKIKGVVGAYLVIVLILNTYFMYSFYGIMASNIEDGVELFFTTMQIIALIILGFVAFAGYLNNEGKQSILFLLMSFCLIFSQVLTFIQAHYISHTLFTIINWFAYVSALVLFYNYLVGHNKTKKVKISTKRASMDKKIAA